MPRTLLANARGHIPARKDLCSMSFRVQPFRSCAATVTLLLLSVVTVAAQGLYYKEVVKDGRIYVFNNAANADRFEKTGAMNGGITKPGVGPKGETVVADSPRHCSCISSSTASQNRWPSRSSANDRLARRQDPHHDGERLP